MNWSLVVLISTQISNDDKAPKWLLQSWKSDRSLLILKIQKEQKEGPQLCGFSHVKWKEHTKNVKQEKLSIQPFFFSFYTSFPETDEKMLH